MECARGSIEYKRRGPARFATGSAFSNTTDARVNNVLRQRISGTAGEKPHSLSARSGGARAALLT